MGYNKSLLNKALEEIKNKGESARRTYDKKKAVCMQQIPRLKEIEQELMQLKYL